MGSKLDGDDENAGTAVQVESSSTCSTKETSPPQPAASHKISLSTYLAIISFWFHYAAANVATVMISAVIANINQDIGPSPVYTWLASSLALASSISVGVAGTVTDLTGRRGYSILFGLVGIVGCIVAVTSKNISQLIGANVLVGLYIGSSENSLSAVSELVTHNQRGAVMACFNAGIGVFTVFGSLIAHAMVRNGSWRSIYYLVIALDVAGTVALFFLYHPQAPLAGFSSYRSLIRGFDWFGLLGLMTGPTLLLLAITWLGGTYPISDVRVLTTLIIGIVAIALLGVYEAFVPENPLLHPHLFRRIRTFTLILIVTIVGGMLYYSLLSFFPLYLSLIYVNDPSDDIKIGVYNIPLQAGSLFGGVTTFWALPKLRKPRPMLIIAVFVQLLFIALMAIPNQNQRPMALAFSFFGAVGLGSSVSLSVLLIQFSVPDKYIGFAGGMLSLFRFGGGAVGTAVYSSIFSSRSADKVPAYVAAAALRNGLPSSSVDQLLGAMLTATGGPVTDVPGYTAEIGVAVSHAVKSAYVASFRYVWLSSIAFGAVSLICTIFVKDLSHQLNDTVAIRLQKEQQQDQQEQQEQEPVAETETETKTVVGKEDDADLDTKTN
ncbi:hypothetical protein Z517_08793 [Fonsecaea pedrosoi CBS 271.37]|uniref:Major facilitator superfamily (MFS) profile domain-containing protein n=1 Tax=Fonsecaea pedrosoi CBS 271.37 TaxID=1442368 RepID=A0A0D2GDX5_9EURO|nr:uncharacterized protein Z517_08793 [Fonsecaea pedrosoi CBS 271.37]KIW78953.1 hypothetical protein Z517_08793 [Fonsecaea pedrosoi CBS 271.37]